MSYRLIRPLLFALPPETAHRVTLRGLALAHQLRLDQALLPDRVNAPVQAMGLSFPNAVGLAAGLDKDGDYVEALAGLGFGFIEIGTVTPRAQPGNPAPRLFRLRKSGALINRMGFNNKGTAHLCVHVPSQRDYVLGINIGRNKDTPENEAAADYETALQQVYTHADYVSVNISSPNTEGLRRLHAPVYLNRLLASLSETRERLKREHGKRVPLVLKVSPDLIDEQIDAIASAVITYEFDGVIATNTTVSREAVAGVRRADEAGGLSGRPLLRNATKVLAVFHRALDGKAALIASGGVMSGNAARVKRKAGADLVQVYTGLVYRGPGLVNECVRALAK